MTREEAAIDYCLFIGNTSLDEVDAFKAGAEWEHKRLVEKACEYLESTLKHDLGYYGAAEFVDTFRKAMEERLWHVE